MNTQIKCLFLAGVLALLGTAVRGGDITTDGLTVLTNGAFYGKLDVARGTVTTNGMKLYYPLNTSGTNVTDDSGNGNTGTVSGAVWTSSGLAGGAYDFSGTNTWITAKTNSSLNITNYLTLAAWVKFKGEAGGVDRNNVFLTKCRSNGTLIQYGMVRFCPADPKKYEFGIFLGTGGSHSDYTSSNALTNDLWYFLAGTYDGTNVNLYENGVGVKTIARSGVIVGDNLGNLDVGRENAYSPAEYANVVMDEVRVFNRALTATEIKQLYNNASPSYSTNIGLNVEGTAQIKRLVPQGDIGMGSYTNGP